LLAHNPSRLEAANEACIGAQAARTGLRVNPMSAIQFFMCSSDGAEISAGFMMC
jgi:hypothetical protein